MLFEVSDQLVILVVELCFHGIDLLTSDKGFSRCALRSTHPLEGLVANPSRQSYSLDERTASGLSE